MNEGGVCWYTRHAWLVVFDMTWHECGVGATFEDVWRRAWVGCVNVSRQREQERGQYSNINGTGHHGSSRRHCVTSWSDAVCASQAEELFKLLFGVERTLWGAASTTIRQELSWATWCEIEVMPTFRGSYGTGMRCRNAYLGWRELNADAGWHGLEGQLGKVSRWSRKATTARGKLISSKYQLLKHVWCVQIELPELLQGWMMFGGGWEIALTETNLFLPIYGTVLRITWTYPQIVCGPVTFVANLFKMEDCWRRSIFWRLFGTKISKFFQGGIWKKIIWEITC